jgi:hypothetical protein
MIQLWHGRCFKTAQLGLVDSSIFIPQGFQKRRLGWGRAYAVQVDAAMDALAMEDTVVSDHEMLLSFFLLC